MSTRHRRAHSRKLRWLSPLKTHCVQSSTRAKRSCSVSDMRSCSAFTSPSRTSSRLSCRTRLPWYCRSAFSSLPRPAPPFPRTAAPPSPDWSSSSTSARSSTCHCLTSRRLPPLRAALPTRLRAPASKAARRFSTKSRFIPTSTRLKSSWLCTPMASLSCATMASSCSRHPGPTSATALSGDPGSDLASWASSPSPAVAAASSGSTSGGSGSGTPKTTSCRLSLASLESRWSTSARSAATSFSVEALSPSPQ
mmetsp:Transcript_387/g.865  ORF Transcript_387/g.865 Transcript_387/m.865 type:complete len:252 (+) Transcript_387:822-1577(+)